MHPSQIRNLERSPDVEAQGKVVVAVFVTLLLIFSAISWILVAIDIRNIRKRQRERDAESGLSSIPENSGQNASNNQVFIMPGNIDPLPMPGSPTTYDSRIHG
ncbi:hypothetical protein F4805DRAFT_455532 [Annulohypoxylon moriforme]|nr:hypothetical protein F4805DRAFT_455532 [Annulohypoxylon moriforme]